MGFELMSVFPGQKQTCAAHKPMSAMCQKRSALALILNYPSNPTALVASLDFYKDVVAFAKKNDIIILSDLAYAEIYFDGNPPPSVLQVPGAIDVAVEFTSMSKTFSMPGWRMGFAVGNERLISALTRVKSYLDYGAFTPIQVAADGTRSTATAPTSPKCATIYHKRRDVMVDAFGRAGWNVPAPAASMFAWAPIPEPFRHLGSLEFSKLLIEHADVAVAPGIGFGEHGDDYVRIALVENEHRIRQAARNIKRFLSSSAEAARTMWCRSPRGAERRRIRCIASNFEGRCRTWRKHCVSGLPGLGHRRRVGGARAARQGGRTDAPVRPRARRRPPFRRATASRDRGVDLGAAKWFDDPVEAGADRRYRRLRRTDRRRRRAGARLR